MITPQFIMDGQRIDKDFLLNIPANNRIMAIKALRYVSGLGLKEAKSAIEEQCCFPTTSSFPLLDHTKLIDFFQQWLKPIPTEKEIREKLKSEIIEDYLFEKNQKVVNRKHKLMKALECIIENWETLGYASDVEACHAILLNFKFDVE